MLKQAAYPLGPSGPRDPERYEEYLAAVRYEDQNIDTRIPPEHWTLRATTDQDLLRATDQVLHALASVTSQITWMLGSRPGSTLTD